jgi:thiamine biosynthesis lipoprotein
MTTQTALRRATSRPSVDAETHVYRFTAMASACEVHVQSDDERMARKVGRIAEAEALRIEHKYSRYRTDSVVSRINSANGAPVRVDEETAGLISYAANCYALSAGLFDITSGVLRRIWRFDGSGNMPSAREVRELKHLIGWSKASWEPPVFSLPQGMEIDFGGFGKEYAVDSALLRITSITSAPVLVNFGGDLRVSGPRRDGKRWRVAIESVDNIEKSDGLLEVPRGALTTSGDAKRCLIKDGVRYSHILDPRTGWPVKDPPRSVTVAAPTCIEAGLLSTLAMLHGRKAEEFLSTEGVQAWVMR